MLDANSRNEVRLPQNIRQALRFMSPTALYRINRGGVRSPDLSDLVPYIRSRVAGLKRRKFSRATSDLGRFCRVADGGPKTRSHPPPHFLCIRDTLAQQPPQCVACSLVASLDLRRREIQGRGDLPVGLVRSHPEDDDFAVDPGKFTECGE